ncbi:unnamed protein product [Protopolystoma xenopodis]|uniref:Uncharacterized protein n=1 Tax=Protopolystoma xenopodis TaxID=117903 RepID=A0A448XHP8_9PLAT|nr:unnamed protein product [Protopolystoma xenopodis]
MEYQGDNKKKKTLFTSLPTQYEKTDKFDFSGVYRIKFGNCEQKYIREIGRKIGVGIKERQRLCRNMDTKRSKKAEYIARTGYEIDWKSTENLAACGENTRKRKIREAIKILTERNLMNRRLEEDRIRENCAYCLKHSEITRQQQDQLKEDDWIKLMSLILEKEIAGG